MVNLDYAASTPLRPEALAEAARYDASEIAGANPNSIHSLGRRAQAALERARRTVAATLGERVRPHEILFTSGGTESNVLALLGVSLAMRRRHPERNRVIVSAIEHDSILDNLPSLRAAGFTTDLVRPDRSGVVEPDALSALMGRDVALVSVMLANNETGVVQPVSELARVAHGSGACFHTDAIQGWLHVPFDVASLGVDALSAAGHKVGGPVSTGVLYLSQKTPFEPLSRGGGQESGRRPGTQDVRSILELAAVAEALGARLPETRRAVQALADRLYGRLLASPRIEASMGDPFAVDRLPGLVSIAVDGGDSDELILQLDARGFMVAAGSACTSSDNAPSHVLRAMGLPERLARGALRVSFDDRAAPEDLDRFAEALLEIVSR